MHEVDIVIPAAGLGTRAKGLGPKAVLQIGHEETLIGRQLRILNSRFKINRTVVVGGFSSDKLADVLRQSEFETQLILNSDFSTTNTAYSVACGISHCDMKRPIVVVYGDLVFNAAALWALESNIQTMQSCVLIDSGTSQCRKAEVGIGVCDAHTEMFAYGLPMKWAHIAVLAGKLIGDFKTLAMQPKHRRLYMYEILNQLVDDHRIDAVGHPMMELVEIDVAADVALAVKLTAKEFV